MNALVNFLLICAILPTIQLAQTCEPVTDRQKDQIESFIKGWYKMPSDQTISLIESSTVDAECYRKLVFRASAPAPLLMLYLTPDGKHLVSGIMDLTIDPAITQRKMRQELADKLSSGAALAACVALQDKLTFWKLHDILFSNQQELSKDTLLPKALDFLTQDKAIDPANVSSCLNKKGFQDSLQRDQQLALDLGINSTPTIFLNGHRIFVKSAEDLHKALHAAEAETVPVIQNTPAGQTAVQPKAP